MNLNWKIISAVAVALSISPAFAQKPKGYTYLALGDSIAFGFDPTKFPPFSPTLPTPIDFRGYPEIVAQAKGLQHVNAACPGETSGSFVVYLTPDNGCNSAGPQGQPPFIKFGLHTSYTESQLSYALNQIRSEKNINLITISLGGNDLSLLQMRCADPAQGFGTCVESNLPGVIASFGLNLTKILEDLRQTAKYEGRLILVTNYSPSADKLFIFAVSRLNKEMIRVGRQFDAEIADGFKAFQSVSKKRGGGDPCTAGLLVRVSATACDIHPSVDGQNLLAATVLLAAEKKNDKDDDD